MKDIWTLKPNSVLRLYRKKCGSVDSFVKDLAMLKDTISSIDKIPRKRYYRYLLNFKLLLCH